MGYKCVPQVKGLVRGEPQPGQKHRANGLKFAKEAGYERGTNSPTHDKKRQHLNEYEGYRSGKNFWEDMEAEADKYREEVPGKTKTGEPIIRYRKAKKNAVIGFAIIYNPPADMCKDWTKEKYIRFRDDSRDCMEKIEPAIFRSENIRMSALHADEGIAPDTENPTLNDCDCNFHDLGVCKDENGRYCGSKIDGRLMDKINEMYPRLMREKGWDLDDVDRTDWQKAKEDKAYRYERNEKRKRSGRSVSKYVIDKAHKQLEDVTNTLDEAVQVLSEAEETAEKTKMDAQAEASDVIRKAQEESEQITKITQQSIDYLNAKASKERSKLKTDAETEVEELKKSAQLEAENIKQTAQENAEIEYKRIINKAKKQINNVKQELIKYEKNVREKEKLNDELEKKRNEEYEKMRQENLQMLIDTAKEVTDDDHGIEDIKDEKDAVNFIVSDFKKQKENFQHDYEKQCEELNDKKQKYKEAYETAKTSYETEVEKMKRLNGGNKAEEVADFLLMMEETARSSATKEFASSLRRTIMKVPQRLNKVYKQWKDRFQIRQAERMSKTEDALHSSLNKIDNDFSLYYGDGKEN